MPESNTCSSFPKWSTLIINIFIDHCIVQEHCSLNEQLPLNEQWAMVVHWKNKLLIEWTISCSFKEQVAHWMSNWLFIGMVGSSFSCSFNEQLVHSQWTTCSFKKCCSLNEQWTMNNEQWMNNEIAMAQGTFWGVNIWGSKLWGSKIFGGIKFFLELTTWGGSILWWRNNFLWVCVKI